MLVFTARRVPGPELFRMGVVSKCCAGDELASEAASIALEIASKSPSAIRAAKRSFNVTEDRALRDGYRFEQSQTAALSDHPDTLEAQPAFAEKRKPKFGT